MVFLTEKERDDIVREIEELIPKKEQEIRYLESIMHHAEYNNVKAMSNALTAFASNTERNFLNGKRLAVLIRENKEVSEYDPEAMGTTDDFPCSLSYENGIWEFHLPPLPSIARSEKGFSSGRYLNYLTKNLIARYKKIHGKISRLSSPIVIFEYRVDKDDAFGRMYDADNRDNKKVLDALSGTFFEDDNIMRITTLYYGVYSETPCANVYVMEMTKFTELASKSGDEKTADFTLPLFAKNQNKN